MVYRNNSRAFRYCCRSRLTVACSAYAHCTIRCPTAGRLTLGVAIAFLVSSRLRDLLSCLSVIPCQRGNPSGVGLAPSNTVAKDAMNLYRSSYLYTEGLSSLGKATAASSSRHSSSNSPSRTTGGVSGTTARAKYGADGGSTSSSSSSSARHERSYNLNNGQLTTMKAAVNGGDSPFKRGRGSVVEPFSESRDDTRRRANGRNGGKRDGKAVGPEHQRYEQSAPACADQEKGPNTLGTNIGGYRGWDRMIGKGEQLGSTSSGNVGLARMASGNLDIGVVLRRFVVTCCS